MICQYAKGQCTACHRPLMKGQERECRGHNQSQTVRASGRPSVLRKVWNYTAAVTRWMMAGSPTRTPEEIARIFAICEACPHFSNENRPHCKLCGCSLSKAPDGLRNKIRFQTEICPDKPPRWE